jgi:hypothetical protein
MIEHGIYHLFEQVVFFVFYADYWEFINPVTSNEYLSIISISVDETVALISTPAFAFFIFRVSIVEVNSLDHFSILTDTGSPAFLRSVDNSREFNLVFS